MSVLLGSNAGNRAPKNWSRKNYLFSTNKKKKSIQLLYSQQDLDLPAGE